MWQLNDITGINNSGDAFLTSVVDTGDIKPLLAIGNFTGVADTGNASVIGVNNTGDEPIEPTVCQFIVFLKKQPF